MKDRFFCQQIQQISDSLLDQRFSSGNGDIMDSHCMDQFQNFLTGSPMEPAVLLVGPCGIAVAAVQIASLHSYKNSKLSRPWAFPVNTGKNFHNLIIIHSSHPLFRVPGAIIWRLINRNPIHLISFFFQHVIKMFREIFRSRTKWHQIIRKFSLSSAFAVSGFNVPSSAISA